MEQKIYVMNDVTLVLYLRVWAVLKVFDILTISLHIKNDFVVHTCSKVTLKF